LLPNIHEANKTGIPTHTLSGGNAFGELEMIAQDNDAAERAVLLDTANIAPVEIASLP
jgi:hypothetical protein